VYHIWFHPLAKFPGPKWNAICHLPASYEFLRGNFPSYLHSLHERYGDVVRIRPGTLSFSSSQASKDILVCKPGHEQLKKDPELFFKSPNGAWSILSVPSDADHSRYRRLLSTGFSQRAIRDQEIILKTYVDLLIQGLHQRAREGPQDMVSWFTWITFDVIGDLTFDRSFDCLRNQSYHEWIPFVFGGVKGVLIRSELSRYPLISKIMMWLDREKILASRERGFRFTEERVNYRIASATDRVDLLANILGREGKEREMSRAEIEATSSTLILGGSDTTATLLAGTVYYLLQNPHTKQKLVAEIRDKFKDEAEIDITAVNKLAYLIATFEEVMRLYPPVALGSPRVVGKKGVAVGGYGVPPKVRRSIHGCKLLSPLTQL
jgi:cytochrome P450